MHHPIVVAVLAWWALTALVVQLGSGAVTVALVSVVGQSLAVLFAFQLTRRAQRETTRKLKAQDKASAKRDVAVRAAVDAARLAAVEAKQTADSTNHLVNSAREELKRELDESKARIATLEAMLARVNPATEGV